jgi:hypothetical protein
MQHYKNHPIRGVAVVGRGRLWHSKGLVFDPAHPKREIKRLECTDIVCTTSKEAQKYALTLCKAWVDGLKPKLKSTH